MRSQVNYLMDKLYEIDQQLGGKAKSKKDAKKKGTEFERIKEIVMESLFALTKKQNERDEKEQKFGRDTDIIRINCEIRDSFNNIEKDLKEMNEIIKRQTKNKKIPKEQIQLNDQIYNNLSNQLNNMIERERGGDVQPQKKYQTLDDLKKNIMNEANKNAKQIRVENNEDEEKALEQFAEADKQQDEKLGVFIDKMDIVKSKAKMMGQKIDQQEIQMKKLTKEVEVTNNTLVSQNKRLKDIVAKYRQPNKFCMDITLLLLFLGLIAVIYNMLQKNGTL